MKVSVSRNIPTNKCSVPINLLDKLLASSTANSITFFDVAVKPILEGSISDWLGFKLTSISVFKLSKSMPILDNI